jgi:hypothetical protein
MKPLLSLALCLVLGPITLSAQEAAEKPAAPPAMVLPKPGPEMARLKALVGTWHVEETVEPSVMGPGGKGHGVAHTHMGPGGFSFMVDYKSAAGPMKGFHGQGVVAWDADAKLYRQAWVDSMAPALMTSTGSWQGDTLVMDTECTMMGKPFKSRDTFTGIGPNGFTITSEMSMDGSPMTKVMTLVHKRVKAEGKK